MALQEIRYRTNDSDRGMRLDQVLTASLAREFEKPLSRGQVRKLIVAGAVYLNRRRVRIASKKIIPGAEIQTYLDLSKLSRPFTAFEFDRSQILFEDSYLIIADKPAGVPTQPTLDEARSNLFGSIQKYLKSSYLGLHHRLDRDTSGVVLFTKKKSINASIAKQFKERTIEKEYRAISLVVREPETKCFEISNYLKKSSKGKNWIMHSVRSGGDSATTRFEVLERFGSYALICAKPLTGRTHQIRVHLQECGLPILGDPVYGGEARKRARRTLLHAAQLTFEHPVDRVTQAVRSALPRDFEECLASIRKDGAPRSH